MGRSVLFVKTLAVALALTAVVAPRTALSAGEVVVDDDVHIQGHYLEWFFAPDDGGVLNALKILGGEQNLAGDEGMLQEGFGVGSYYVPNRRLNEKLEMVDQASGRPMLRYRYDCDGPNIKGLQVSRLMEPLPEESSIRVVWTIENKGDESQWIAPWVRNEMRVGAASRMDLPTLDGVVQVAREAYYPASRNWAAVTDLERRETVYAVFHADHTHAFLATCGDSGAPEGIQTAYVPRLLGPGEAWTTMYRLNVVRGLDRVDFASDELALKLSYENGKLTALISAARNMENVHIEGRIVAENKRVWRLPRKRFDASPAQLARCSYDWTPPADGVYEFLAQLSQGDEVISLGEDTASPHGGIDARFVAGNPPPRPMEAWTDAPHLLDQGPRETRRSMAGGGAAALWFASSLEKVFRQDVAVANGPLDPVARIALARNERESFQICLRPPSEAALIRVSVAAGDLVASGAGARIPAADVAVHNVLYHDVRIPTHYEGPTGQWPDALPEHQPFTAEGGETTPVWVTVRARPGLPPGLYRGPLTISAANGGPWELWIEARVHDFELPTTPALKTDFGFSIEALNQQARRLGVNPETLAQGYLQNALDHRVTLRELCGLPRESADYQGDLTFYEKRLGPLQAAGATTFYAPASLLDAPQQLEQANAFVRKHNLSDRTFTQLAYEPEEPAWNRVLERMQAWKDRAPDIPILVSAKGLKPFIPEGLDIWSVHAQVLDTTHNIHVLRRAEEGGQVWWYVNHAPPRPYGNFFLDFAAIEHRILFWQSWALGMGGMQYWQVNYWPPEEDPYTSLLDVTPVNGDGLLVYPGPKGPVNSIRWETIRDGIEDYDYLALFMEHRRRLLDKGGREDLLRRAAEVYNLESVTPNLVTFTRTPEVLLKKRDHIAEMIVEMQKAL